MAIKDIFKINRKTFFYPTGWLGLNSLKNQFDANWSVIKNTYAMPEGPNRVETFEEALKRFNLTETQIKQISINFLYYSITFVTCGILTLLFSFFLLFYYVEVAGFVLGIATSSVFFAYAFRYSFWRFEITNRKLGCTFDEWWQGKPLEKGE